jgi:chitodextrinase
VTPATVPGAPTAATAVQQAGVATVTVSWTAPTSTGGSAIASYLARALPDTTKTCTWFTGALSCQISGLTPGTAYPFQVRATNSVGNGAISAASSSVTVLTRVAPFPTESPLPRPPR